MLGNSTPVAALNQSVLFSQNQENRISQELTQLVKKCVENVESSRFLNGKGHKFNVNEMHREFVKKDPLGLGGKLNMHNSLS